MLVFTNFLNLIPADDEMGFTTDCLEQIFLDANVLVPLCVNKQLLFAFFIFKANFVETTDSFTLARSALNTATGLVIGQFIRRQLRGVVDAADNNRLVLVPVLKGNDHL